MMISNTARLISFCLILIVIFLLLYWWTVNTRNKNSSSSTSPASPTSSITNSTIQTGGTYMIAPDGKMVYITRNKDNTPTYYDAGTCDECLLACQTATPASDVYTFVSCADLPPDQKNLCPGHETDKNKFVSFLSVSAQSYIDSLLEHSTSKLTQQDCLATLNNGTSPEDKLQNEQILETISGSMNSGTTIWDYLNQHRDALIQAGIPLLLGYINHYLIELYMLPLLTSEQGRQMFFIQHGYMISRYAWNNYIKSWINTAVKKLSTGIEEKLFEQTDRSIMDYSLRLAAEVAMRTTAEGAVWAIRQSLEVLVELTDGALFIIDILMLVGMFLDALDPCGLDSYIGPEDVESICTSFDKAYYTQVLQNYSDYPVEWFYENVITSGIVCGAGNSVQTLSENLSKDIDKTVYNSKSTDSNDPSNPTDPCDADNQKLSDYMNLYYDNLTTNALGQCIQKLDNTYVQNRLAQMGINVTFDTSSPPFGAAVLGENINNYFVNELANDNVIVANFIAQYWWIIALIVIAIIGIAFAMR